MLKKHFSKDNRKPKMDGVVTAYRLGHRSLGSNFARRSANPLPAATKGNEVLVGARDDSKHDETPAVDDADRDSLDDNVVFGAINPAYDNEENTTNMIKESNSAMSSSDGGESNLNTSSPVEITSITHYSERPVDVLSDTSNPEADSPETAARDSDSSLTPASNHIDNADVNEQNVEIVQSETSDSASASTSHKTTFITLQLKHSSNISAFSASPWRPQSAPPPPPPLHISTSSSTLPDISQDNSSRTIASPATPTHVSSISFPNFSSAPTSPLPSQPSTPAPSLSDTPTSSTPTSPLHIAPQTPITEPHQPSSPAPSLPLEPDTPITTQSSTPLHSLPSIPTLSTPLAVDLALPPPQPKSSAPSLPTTPAASKPSSPAPSPKSTPPPSPKPSPPPSPKSSPPPSPKSSPPPSPKSTPGPVRPPSPIPLPPPLPTPPPTPTSPTGKPTLLYQASLPSTPTSPSDEKPILLRQASLPPTPTSSTGKPTLLSYASLSSSVSLLEETSLSLLTPSDSPQDDPIPSPPTTPPPPVPPPENEGPKPVEEEVIQKVIVKKEYMVLQQNDESDSSALKLVEGEPTKTTNTEPIQALIALIADEPEEQLVGNVTQPVIQPMQRETQQCDMISLPANKPPLFKTNRSSDADKESGNVPPPRNARHLMGRPSEYSEESDLETWYISPPANKGGRKADGNRQVVDRQPNIWVPYTLDPISKAEFENLPAIHKTYGELKMTLKTELGEMSNNDGDGSFALKDSISYIEFFRGLLYDDEEVLMNNQYIPFSHAVFNLFDDWLPSANTTTNRNADKVQVMLMGRVILTNHRLILISAEQQEGAELKKLNLNNDKPGGYQIRTMHQDTLHYRCIPLNKFHSIEMQASVGVIKSTNVVGNRLSCCSCSCLPGLDFFSKRWQVQETLSTRTNSRLVTCGVILPPWDSRAALQIYMAPSVPLYHVKNFMLELQKNSPGLHPSAVPSFAGY